MPDPDPGVVSSGPLVGPAVVVGGGSGIGAALVGRYREAGVPVVVWDRAGSHDITCDITDPGQVDEALAATVERLGIARQFTVCAGVGHSGLLLDVEPEEWSRVMTVNARGPLLAMRAAARALIGGGTRGSIVALSSVSARLPDRTMGTYCASKAALSMLVRVAAAEWSEAGIRVNAVAPGVTDTPMLGGAPLASDWLRGVAGRTALGRIGTADDIADAVIAVHGLAWMTGQVVEVDGGLGLHSPIGPPATRGPGRANSGRGSEQTSAREPPGPSGGDGQSSHHE